MSVVPSGSSASTGGTWRDRLQPASFRGVAFYFDQATLETGRRAVPFEFPLRDQGWVKDLGRRLRHIRLTAYVLGADYDRQRTALEAALEQAGPAQLVLPTRGRMQMQVDRVRSREAREEGGFCRIEIEFLEAPPQAAPGPAAAPDTASAANSAATSLFGAIGAGFQAAYSIATLPARLAAEAANTITGLAGSLLQLGQLPGLALGSVGAGIVTLQTSALALAQAPATLALTVTALFQDFATAVIAAAPVPTSPIPGPGATEIDSRGGPPVADPAAVLAAIAAAAVIVPSVPASFPEATVQLANAAALGGLVADGAVAAMAEIAANTDYASAADAQAARLVLAQLIDTRATAAADLAASAGASSAFDALYQAWLVQAAASAADLTARALTLPGITGLDFAASLPALTLAQRLYQDAGRAPELVARNAAPHPLFMPASIEALAS